MKVGVTSPEDAFAAPIKDIINGKSHKMRFGFDIFLLLQEVSDLLWTYDKVFKSVSKW
jgi:hypothetical protein